MCNGRKGPAGLRYDQDLRGELSYKQDCFMGISVSCVVVAWLRVKRKGRQGAEGKVVVQ